MELDSITAAGTAPHLENAAREKFTGSLEICRVSVQKLKVRWFFSACSSPVSTHILIKAQKKNTQKDLQGFVRIVITSMCCRLN